ncbi:MAG: hypothetical protein IAC58_01430 [Firmicutes bacterium]|uniref:Uncharacterized protein n=1 Tax=Candidatus Onthovivens merdipullorum TaxID=2840889 RepID=A0A9D9GWC5_9BACL|nr:hypothetical protein [Candidatus Onthovivens merdipullorum]
MENYVFLNRYNNDGILALSKKVFLSLGEHALYNVKEIIKKSNKKGINLNDQVQVAIKNNRVNYKFNMMVDTDVDDELLKTSIKDIIATNLLMICDFASFDIDVKVKKNK